MAKKQYIKIALVFILKFHTLQKEQVKKNDLGGFKAESFQTKPKRWKHDY